jgi:hypothetical protein
MLVKSLRPTRTRRAPRGAARAASPAGARIGRFEAVAADGSPLVTAAGWLEERTPALLAATPPSATLEESIGARVVLIPLEGDVARAAIIGWVAAPKSARRLRVDGETIHVSAEHELELRCGKASVTLTADGRVLIRGRGILTHAREVNRIRGGQVQIN